MAKVYSPEDVLKKRVETIPDYVIDAFNDLLTENYQENETITFAYIEQEDVIRKILEYSTDDELTRETIFKKHYLDIENLYRNNGWEVNYKKPMFNEHFKAYFVFKSKKNKF